MQCVQWIQALNTTNDNISDDSAVPESMVGQKQIDYKFQPGFNFLKDRIGLDTKMASNCIVATTLAICMPQAISLNSP